MNRRRFNFIKGIVGNNLTSSSTTLTSNGLTSLPEITYPDYVVIVIQPAAANPEIVYITEHEDGSSQAVIERGKEGTSPRAHNNNVQWIHGLLVDDFADLVGPEGPPGRDFTYYHSQDIPSTTWVIEHNLGGYPNVSVVDSGSTVVEGNIMYNSENVVTIEFNSAFAGSAYLS